MNISDLSHRLEAYLELRRALGFDSPVEAARLQDFIRYVERCPPGALQTAQTAVDWACSVRPCASGSQAHRLSLVRRFLVHLHASFPDIVIPGRNLLTGATRRKPHIYSPAEIQALLQAAQALGPPGSLRPLTYFTLIGLVASCGLRAGEAIRLQRSDVLLDADAARLHVQKTKFRKSRWVPLHTTTAVALRTYAAERARLGYHGFSEAFFLSEKKTPLNYHVAAHTFVTLARHLGIRGPIGERGASLHSLRHTFVVRRMQAWYQEGVDVRARLPELSVYLGHVRPEDTYWYMTATPELLAAAAERFERYRETGGDL